MAIVLDPNKTLKTWAKYAVPSGSSKVSVVIAGAEPFESIEITEPAPGG
ncbi:MAG TPA: hypothetical protein VJ723_11460 [Candidatus Angelobacter sp.]|nr:hypothetical protein [Candidatus Angelobacter sp.]